MRKNLALLFLLCLGSLGSVRGQDFTDSIRAFPGAEGFGAYVTGGRGGKVVAVTNLNDDGEGSLRWALKQHSNEPITVIFRVSGHIALESEIRVKRQNFTIAGQTAPGSGICIIDNKINFGGSQNFIIRYIRARQGRLSLYDNSFSVENGSNFIIDHCTFGWAPSEIMTVYDNDLATVQWCLVHEAMDRSFGCQWGGERTTYHHNLLTHNENRNPRFNGARATSPSAGDRNVLIEYVNNVHYNWGRETSSRGHDIETTDGRYGNSNRTNMVSNYWKPGPARPGDQKTVFTEVIGRDLTKFPLFYMHDNVMESEYDWAVELNNNNYLGLRLNDFGADGIIENFKSDVPIEIPEQYRMVNSETAHEAYESVLAGVGAFPRDAQELRIINEVRTGTTTGLIGGQGKMPGIISDPAVVGGHPMYCSLPAPVDTDGDGMSDWYEDEKGLDKNNPADGNYRAANKYTNLENYLNDISNFLPRPNSEGKYDQCIWWSQELPNSIGGSAVKLTATASSNLSITYSSDNPGVATVSNDTLRVVGPGTAILTASQGGNAEYSAISLQRTIVVKINQTITWNQTLTGVYGDTLTLTASSSNSTIPLVYASAYPSIAKVVDDNKLVLLMPSGAIDITVSQVGNDSYNAATSVVRSVTIGKRSQTITWNQTLSATYGDTPITLNATSDTKSVTYTSSNTSLATISSVKLNILGAGDVTITAKQVATTYYLAAPDVAKTFTIAKAPQAITWDQELPLMKVGDAPLILMASAPGGSVSYTSSNPEVARLSSSSPVRLTAVKGGEATITASRDSSQNYLAATSVSKTVTVEANQDTIPIPPTGISQNNQIPVQVYPNPANAVLNLSFDSESTYEVSMVDMSGAVAYRATVRGSSYTINISGYYSGTYLLIIEDGKGNRTAKKIIVGK